MILTVRIWVDLNGSKGIGSGVTQLAKNWTVSPWKGLKVQMYLNHMNHTKATLRPGVGVGIIPGLVVGSVSGLGVETVSGLGVETVHVFFT